MNEKLIGDFSFAFWNFIPQYHRFMHKYYNRCSKFSLNKNQKKAMMIIHYHGKMCMSYLGECIDLQKGSLTTLVDSLEKEGYIKRLPQTNDRRKTILTLTTKANDLVKKRQNEIKGYIHESFKNISNNEIEELINSFRKITNIMEKL